MIQRLFFALFLTVASVSSYAQMEFTHDKSWEEVIKMAAQKKKLIFVDAFTDWCGPCKMMTANTFPDPEVGKFFNDNFINVKLDMEKGEGLTFAQKYGVRAYPTLMFINPENQQVVYTILGYRKPDQFLAEGQKAAVLSPFSGATSGTDKPKKPKKVKKPKKEKTPKS